MAWTFSLPMYEQDVPFTSPSQEIPKGRHKLARGSPAGGGDVGWVFGPRPMGERRFTEEEERMLLDKLREALLKEPTLEDLVELRKSVRIQE